MRVAVSLVFLTALFFFSLSASASAQQQRPPRKQKLCSEMSEEERRRTERCKTEEEQGEDEYQRRLAKIAEKEKPAKSSFMKWVHLDGGWVQSEDSTIFQGLIGAHVAIFESGRLQFYGPPGVMLIRQEFGENKHRLRPATTWGFSFRLFDSRIPGTGQQVRIFANFAKVWLLGGSQDNIVSASSSIDMMGLSVTFAK
jgi:hypothetical protein